MVSIIEKATNKVVVSSISASKLEEYGNHRMFILNHLPSKNISGSLDQEADKYRLALDINNFSDPQFKGAIRGYLEGSNFIRARDNDDEFLLATSPMSPPAQQMFRGVVGGAASPQPDSSSHSTPTFFGAVSTIPIKLEGDRVEESKNQGAARLDNPEGQMLHSKGHGRKSARDKSSISKDRKKETPTKAARSNSSKKPVVIKDPRKDTSVYAD